MVASVPTCNSNAERRKMMKKTRLSLTLCLLLIGTTTLNADDNFGYFDLGVGNYGAGVAEHDDWGATTYLDKARLGWVYLVFGNPPHPSKETTEMLWALRSSLRVTNCPQSFRLPQTEKKRSGTLISLSAPFRWAA